MSSGVSSGVRSGVSSGVVSGLVLRSRGGRLSLRIQGRAVAVTAALSAALLVVAAVTLTTGEYELSLAEVIRALAGQGSPGAEFIVTDQRLPRLLTAVFTGVALAVSGAILQSLTGNALGSPDIIGFTNGAATGALLAIVLWQGSMTQIAAGALVGGLATAVAVWLLLLGRGLHGFRLVVVGIGVSSLLLAANSYLITRASLQDALEGQAWLLGSLTNRGATEATALGIGLVLLLPLALGYARRLAMLEMGDDTATSLGINAGRSRLILFAVSVALASLATAATGPISFIALAAPQLARRLTRSAGPGLIPAALMGALLLAASDLAVQRIFLPTLLPVGTATGVTGGLYLIWLLVRESRKSRA